MSEQNSAGLGAIPPGVRQAVEGAIRKEIHPLMEELAAVLAESKKILAELKSDEGLTNLQRKEELGRCENKLLYAESKIKDLESAVEVHRELARRRKEDTESLKTDMAKVVAEVSFLRSALDNQDDEGQV